MWQFLLCARSLRMEADTDKSVQKQKPTAQPHCILKKAHSKFNHREHCSTHTFYVSLRPSLWPTDACGESALSFHNHFVLYLSKTPFMYAPCNFAKPSTGWGKKALLVILRATIANAWYSFKRANELQFLHFTRQLNFKPWTPYPWL